MVRVSKKGNNGKKATKSRGLSKLSSKRKLSRMGKVQRRGESGVSSAFVSRNVAMKRLQLTLRDFRRLCILKGVFPREVSKMGSKFDSRQTYYSIKDMAALAHEPLLAKFREFKTLMRKVRKLAGRREVDLARRKHERYSSYTLHKIIKERYPRFADALYDADDALSTICLFASLPAEGRVDAAVIARCTAIETKWNDWLLKTGSLTKAFISVKGIYLEARVKSGTIVWIVPHRYAVPPPSKKDVDYRVMLTFVELYEVLLSFILIKLYKDDAADLTREDYPRTGVFKGLVFAFSREASYPWLALVAKCGGATVLDDASNESSATHVVTDRPNAPTIKIGDSCELVQPQWIVDSFNTGLKLPVARYAPSADLPPHLSPFASDEYVPAYKEHLDELKSAYVGLAAHEQQEQQQEPVQRLPDEQAKRTNDLATVVMSKKAKRLHSRMLHGIQRKREAIDKLRARRAKLDQLAAKRTK